MKFFKTINISQRIQLVVVAMLAILFTASAFAIYRLSYSRTIESTSKQMMVYLDKINQIIDLIEKDSNPGFSHNDYLLLKPYFNESAFYTTDYPFLVDNSGNLLIHLFKEGQKFPREHLKKMFSNADKFGSFKYDEYRNNTKHRMVLFFKKVDHYNGFIAISVDTEEAVGSLNTNRMVLVFLVIIGTIAFIIAISYTLKPFVKAIQKINTDISLLARGQIASKISYTRNDEISQIIISLNQLIDGLQRTTEFANHIGKNNLNADFEPLSKDDQLGTSLLNMRHSLVLAEEENNRRKMDDEKRNWATSGIAKFGEILRQNNNNLQTLSDNVIQNLVNYLNANQGGLFMLNEADNKEQYLELISAFAFNRKKKKAKTIMVGEGLVGNCAEEKQTIYLKEIPEDYIEITSGLGDASPRSLIIVPLKLEDKIFGVIEIASFNEFQPHEIEFVEKVGESIASTLSSVKNSIMTAQLLEQSQQQREEMAAQEEEMRQNMEEMQATQEEMARKTLEMEGMTSAINESLIFAEFYHDGSFIMANPIFMKATGFGKFDLENKVLKDFIHPSELSLFNNTWKEIISGTPFKGVLKWNIRSDEELYILCSISPVFDEHGEIFKIFFLGQDVTDSKKIELKAQKQAEEIEQSLMELKIEQEIAQQKEQEMASLLKALDSTCLVTELTSEGQITYINNKNVEVLGDPKEKIEGKYLADIDQFAKKQPAEYKRFWDELLAGNPKHREFWLTVKNKIVWISEHYTPIKNSKGQVEKIIIIGIDISESKEIERKLNETIKSLESKLNK